MKKRNALPIALVTLTAVTVILVHLSDTQPWLFHQEVRIAGKLRRSGADVKLANHRIVEVTFSHSPATDDALALLHDLHNLETLKLNSEWHHDRAYPVETSESNIGDAGLLALQGLPSLKHVAVNLDGTDVTAAGLECFRSMDSVEHFQVHLNSAASDQDGLQCFSGMTQLQTLILTGGSRVESLTWFQRFSR